MLLAIAVETGWLPAGGMHSPGADSLDGAGRFRDTLRHLADSGGCAGDGHAAGAGPPHTGECGRCHGRALRARRPRARHSATAAGCSGIFCPAALNPLVSLFGFSLGTLLSASLLVEVLVGWPGLGPLFLEAIMARDFALVLGVVMSSAVLLIAGNLIADLLLYRADPRIRTPWIRTP